MDSHELSEWIVFDNRIRITPLEVLSADIRHALACALTEKGKPRPKHKDFLPDKRPRNRQEMSGDEIMNAFKSAFTDKKPKE